VTAFSTSETSWRDNVIWSRQRRWRDQKGQIKKYFLGEIIFEILNKKGLKYKKSSAGCSCRFKCAFMFFLAKVCLYAYARDTSGMGWPVVLVCLFKR
jgi:hypothetical protein